MTAPLCDHSVISRWDYNCAFLTTTYPGAFSTALLSRHALVLQQLMAMTRVCWKISTIYLSRLLSTYVCIFYSVYRRFFNNRCGTIAWAMTIDQLAFHRWLRFFDLSNIFTLSKIKERLTDVWFKHYILDFSKIFEPPDTLVKSKNYLSHGLLLRSPCLSVHKDYETSFK